MTISDYADITPNSTATAISVTEGAAATWVTLVATGNTCRFGANPSGSQGAKLPAGVPVTLRAKEGDIVDRIDLTKLKVYATGSDSISVTVGT